MRQLHIGIAMLAAAGLAGCERGRPLPSTNERRTLPFRISRETTGIIEPVRADGTVDYVAAINQKYGKGVTPGTNGFVLWLKVVGTGDTVLEPRTREKVLKMCGAERATDGEVWESYEDFLKRRNAASGSDPGWQEVVTAVDVPWIAGDHPDLAAFLESQEVLLRTVGVAAERPRWWTPWVADGREAVIALIPSLGLYREIGTILCARATFRARSGDFEGFLADIRTVRRLARHLASQPTLLELLVGTAIEQFGLRAMAAVVAGGNLTEKQCQDVAVCLSEFAPLEGMANVVDGPERWIWLDMIQWIATGKGDQLRTGEMPGTLSMAGTIDHDSVNWDVVFKRVNAAVDEMVQVARTERFSELRARNAALAERAELNFKRTLEGRTDLRRERGETPEAYSDRIANSLLSSGLSSGKAEELLRKNGQMVQMMGVLLAAAQVRAKTGSWPETEEEMPGRGLKELPRDLYSEQEAKPFRYLVRSGGPRVYTVGENGRDDGGVADGMGKDDLGIGTR